MFIKSLHLRLGEYHTSKKSLCSHVDEQSTWMVEQMVLANRGFLSIVVIALACSAP